jgi:hypothetical protein
MRAERRLSYVGGAPAQPRARSGPLTLKFDLMAGSPGKGAAARYGAELGRAVDPQSEHARQMWIRRYPCSLSRNAFDTDAEGGARLRNRPSFHVCPPHAHSKSSHPMRLSYQYCSVRFILAAVKRACQAELYFAVHKRRAKARRLFPRVPGRPVCRGRPANKCEMAHTTLERHAHRCRRSLPAPGMPG